MTKQEMFGDVFKRFRTVGIKFCALRNDLDIVDSDGELDILVSRDQSRSAIAELGRLGFQIIVRERFIPHKVALVRFAGKKFQVIDLHMEVVQDGFIYLDAHTVLDRRRCVHDFFLPGDADFFVIMVVHNIVGKGLIQEKHYSQIVSLMHAVNPHDLSKSLEKSPELKRLIDRVVKAPNTYQKASAETRDLRREMIKVLRVNDPRSFFFRARRSAARTIRRFNPKTKAPLYVFLGVDGVGKSSICSALADIFNEQGIMRATLFYMGPWGHYLLPFMRGEMFVPGWSISFSEWLTGITKRAESNSFTLWDVLRISQVKRKGHKLSEVEAKLHGQIRSRSKLYLTARFVRSTLSAWKFLATLMLEMGYRYFKIYKLRRRGTTVIADRYIYDLLTGRMHEEIPNYERTRKVLCRLFFKPTKTFLLTNDSKTILKRKRDLSPGQLEKFTTLYAQLAVDYNFDCIRTNSSPKILAARIIEENMDDIVSMARR